MSTINPVQAGITSPNMAAMQAQRDEWMQPVSDLLGMSVQDIDKARQSGQTLAQIAAGQGVSRDDLLAKIKDAIKANPPQGATTAPTDDQLTEIANHIADRVVGKHHHGGHAKPPAVDDPNDPNNPNNLATLANLLKMDPDKLKQELQSGQQLSDIAQTQGVSTSALLNQFGKGLVLNEQA